MKFVRIQKNFSELCQKGAGRSWDHFCDDVPILFKLSFKSLSLGDMEYRPLHLLAVVGAKRGWRIDDDGE